MSGFYDSGKLEPLRSYLVEPDRPLIESDIAILVTSMDKTAVIPIRVAEMFRVRPEQPMEWDSDIPILDMSGGSSKPSHESKSPTPSGLPPDPNLGFVILPDPLLNRGTAASLPTDQEGAEQPKKKMSNFWGGRRLFYPSTAKLRDE